MMLGWDERTFCRPCTIPFRISMKNGKNHFKKKHTTLLQLLHALDELLDELAEREAIRIVQLKSEEVL